MLIIVTRQHGGFDSSRAKEQTVIARIEHHDSSPDAFGRFMDQARETIQNDVNEYVWPGAMASYSIVVEGIIKPSPSRKLTP